MKMKVLSLDVAVIICSKEADLSPLEKPMDVAFGDRHPVIVYEECKKKWKPV